MIDLPPLERAVLVGAVSGLLMTMPIGPINLTIINEAARFGFKKALVIGLGATTMEVLYCGVAFTGLASFFTGPYIAAILELCSFVFILYLGFRFLFARSLAGPVHLGAAEQRFREKIDRRWRPHSAFATGFVRVLANPAVLVFWVILAANFMAREWVDPTHPGSTWLCVAGVGLSTQLWYTLLAWLVSIKHKELTERALIRLEKFTGMILIVLAVIHGSSLAWSIAKHKIHRFRHRSEQGLRVESVVSAEFPCAERLRPGSGPAGWARPANG